MPGLAEAAGVVADGAVVVGFCTSDAFTVTVHLRLVFFFPILYTALTTVFPSAIP